MSDHITGEDRRPGGCRGGSVSDATTSPCPPRFFSVLSQGRHISDVSPHGQETSAVVEGTMSGGQARKRVLLPLESPAGLPPVWSSSPGSSLMAVLKLITGRRRKPPHLA